MEKRPNIAIEEAMVAAFVRPTKVERYLEFLRTVKGRRKFLSELPHFSEFDPRYRVSIEPSHRDEGAVLNLLRERGASATCYVVSLNRELDQVEGDLDQLVDQVVGYEPGTIISCLPGRLAYYEGEDRNDRYVLAR